MKTVGTVVPCSRNSAKKMTRPVNFEAAQTIVELGAGTGAITKEILRRMKPDARLIAFETNKKFCKSLERLNDPRLTVIHDSAEHLRTYLDRFGIANADYIISTLPLALFHDSLKEGVFRAIHDTLDPRGRYVQIQYSLISWNELKRSFPAVRLDFTPFNFPPAFFYICEAQKNPLQ